MADPRKPDAPGAPPAVAGSGTEVIAGDVADAGWAAPALAPHVLPIDLPDREARYAVECELARGSMGIITVARDLRLQRRVAVKTLNPESRVPNAAARFADEARITAQLQHPGIVAVYEIDVGADAAPFFTMQLVEGRTLGQILEGLREGSPDAVRAFGRVRLLNVFNQVCMAVAYAHSRGVIHRDLKPDNIMLGEFGEVYVMDWGLAKIYASDVDNPVVGGRPDDDVYRTRVGDIAGTPCYMSPEQAMGLIDVLNPRTDIYALGAILYELLTRSPPHTGDTSQEVLRKVRAGRIVPPSQAAPDLEVPPELDGIALRCMSLDQGSRYASATDLRDEIEAFLAGGRTVMRRVRGASRTVRDAARASQSFKDLARRRRRVSRELHEAESLRLSFDPPDVLQQIQGLQTQLDELEAVLGEEFAKAVALYQQVLSETPEHRDAQEGLRDLFWYRFLEAERQDDAMLMDVFSGLARQHDRDQSLRAAVTGDGALTLIAEPSGARVTLYRYTLDGRRLAPTDPIDCGLTPLTLDPLPMGSYLLLLETDGCEPTRVPLSLARQEAAEVQVRLLRAGELPPGCIHVPGGVCWLGANDPSLAAPPRQRTRLPGFVITREPITVDEYAEFINDLAERDPPRARIHLPKGEGPLRRAGVDGAFHAEGHGRNPITHITAVSAAAYCAWRGERDGLPWRLPTDPEWELALRGADGRAYPWGSAWEPTWCRCVDSPEGGAPSPVGNEWDESPFGARDGSGGVREWTASEHPRHTRCRAIKGGGFASLRAECHLAVRRYLKVDRAAPDLGFRMAMTLT